MSWLSTQKNVLILLCRGGEAAASLQLGKDESICSDVGKDEEGEEGATDDEMADGIADSMA